MEFLRNALAFVWTAHVDWQLILRFVEVTIWPAVTLIGIASARPILTQITDGGEITAAGATLKFRQKVETAGATIDEVEAEEEPGDPLDAEESSSAVTPPAAHPLADSDPYTTVMNGWGLVTQGLENAAEMAGAAPLERIRPLKTVNRLLDLGLISKKHKVSAEELFEIRNNAKNAGSSRAQRRGLTPEVADQYYAQADQLRRSIVRTVRRRLQRRSGLPVPSQSSGDAERTLN